MNNQDQKAVNSEMIDYDYIKKGRKQIRKILSNDLEECMEDRNMEEGLYSVLDGIRASFDVAALGTTVGTDTEATNDLNMLGDASHTYVIMITEALYVIGGIGIGLRRWWRQKNEKVDYKESEQATNLDPYQDIETIMKRLPLALLKNKHTYFQKLEQELDEAMVMHRMYKQRLLKNLRSFMMYRMLSVTMSLVTIVLLSINLSEGETDNTVGFLLTGINLAFSRAVSQLTSTRLQKLAINVDRHVTEEKQGDNENATNDALREPSFFRERKPLEEPELDHEAQEIEMSRSASA